MPGRQTTENMPKFSKLPVLAVVCLSMCIGLNACYYDVEQDLYPDDFVPCDTTTVTYSGNIAPLMIQACMPCHSTSSANAGVVLDNHAGTKIEALNGRLYGSVAHLSGFSPMPKNVPQLPGCEISKVKIWVDAGAPNN